MLHNNINKFLNISIICLILLTSCSTTMIDRSVKYNENMVLEEISSFDPSFDNLNSLLYVNIDKQSMYLLKKGTISRAFKISTSYYGTGSETNSFKTPLGKHEIYKKIGEDLPINAILKGRVWNGAIANVITDDIDTDFDHVTSRILWLDGKEKGINSGKGIDSFQRYIYIHGTHEEGLIGKKASHGCIRMFNRDVVSLYEYVEEGTKVYIKV